MDTLFKIVVTACLTLLGGCALYLFAQTITELLVKPYLEYRRVLSDIIFKLVFYANIIKAINSAPPELERDGRISLEMRELSARLRAAVTGLPPLIQSVHLIPSHEDIKKAAECLIGVSNAMMSQDKDYVLINQDIQEAARLLRIDV